MTTRQRPGKMTWPNNIVKTMVSFWSEIRGGFCKWYSFLTFVFAEVWT